MLKQQALRFIATGILNTLVGYSLYALFLWCGLNHSLALAFSTVLGVLFNFKTIGTLVFKSNNNALILKFVLVYLVTFLINLLLINFLVTLGLSAYVAGIVVIIPAAALSFILNKYFVFK